MALDKGIFIQGLIDEARRSGVEIFTNTNVVDVRKTEQGLVVSDSYGNYYVSEFVIAADGINSRIVRNLGVNKQRTFSGTWRCKAWTMVDADVSINDVLMICLGTKTGISIAPCSRPGEVHVASSTYFHGQDLDGPFREFTKSSAYASWFKNAKDIEHHTACVTGVRSSLPVPFKDNILFAGDAGWVQEISIIGAMVSGWNAASAVVEALKANKINREGIQSYLDWWTANLYGPHGPRVESTGDLGDYLDPADFDYMGSLIKAPLVGTMNVYQVIKTIGKAYVDVLPQIQEERPDIMEKLMAIRSRTEYEALFERKKNGFLND
jgi:flavin-dependent dehydrogenase